MRGRAGIRVAGALAAGLAATMLVALAGGAEQPREEGAFGELAEALVRHSPPRSAAILAG